MLQDENFHCSGGWGTPGSHGQWAGQVSDPKALASAFQAPLNTALDWSEAVSLLIARLTVWGPVRAVGVEQLSYNVIRNSEDHHISGGQQLSGLGHVLPSQGSDSSLGGC
jgi:hypothetical protein